MNWTKETKEKLYTGLAFLSFMVGVVLVFTGLLLPPAGQIDGNVLVGVGEFLSLTAGLLGISEHFNSEFRNFKREIRHEIDTHNYNHSVDSDFISMPDTEDYRDPKDS